MKCACGEELISDGINGMCSECRMNAENIEYFKTGNSYTGWRCPKCGYVWAIWVEGCSNCNQPKLEIKTMDGGDSIDTLGGEGT